MKGTNYRDQNTKDTNTEYRLKINNNRILGYLENEYHRTCTNKTQ